MRLHVLVCAEGCYCCAGNLEEVRGLFLREDGMGSIGIGETRRNGWSLRNQNLILGIIWMRGLGERGESEHSQFAQKSMLARQAGPGLARIEGTSSGLEHDIFL